MAALPLKKKKPQLPPESSVILIVDDDKFIRELCENALYGYRILQAETCEEALKVYAAESVDLILSDICMPGESGIELLKQVKQLDPNATVIIMTGFADKEMLLNALKEDADDFINKPLNFLQLRTAVEKTLGRKALKEELANIKRSDQLKNAFLSLVSHKLRTPLTGISLFLQNLRYGGFTPGDPDFLENLALADEEAVYLDQLVADLLTFSQVMVKEGSVSSAPADLNEIVDDVLQRSREKKYHPTVKVHCTPGKVPLASLNVEKVSFAILQVINNAFKFSRESSLITVCTGTREGSLYISVTDSGSGIPDSEVQRIFEKFYQIDPDNTGQVRGFGLGLFFARDFVRQHGGDITLVSEPNNGTTVTINIPLKIKK